MKGIWWRTSLPCWTDFPSSRGHTGYVKLTFRKVSVRTISIGRRNAITKTSSHKSNIFQRYSISLEQFLATHPLHKKHIRPNMSLFPFVFGLERCLLQSNCLVTRRGTAVNPFSVSDSLVHRMPIATTFV